MGFGNQVDVLVAKPIKQFHVCVVLNVQDYIERKCYKLCNLPCRISTTNPSRGGVAVAQYCES